MPNFGGSLLPSENNDTCTPQAWGADTLTVKRVPEREVYQLWLSDRVLIAEHANGHSCKELADRMIAAKMMGSWNRANEQRRYIRQCGGVTCDESVFDAFAPTA